MILREDQPLRVRDYGSRMKRDQDHLPRDIYFGLYLYEGTLNFVGKIVTYIKFLTFRLSSSGM